MNAEAERLSVKWVQAVSYNLVNKRCCGDRRITSYERVGLQSGLSAHALITKTQSVYANCGLGSTGHWPVPSGDSPDGMGRASPANEDSLILGAALLVPVGGSPTGTGVSPVLPIFKHALMLPRNPEYSKSRN